MTVAVWQFQKHGSDCSLIETFNLLCKFCCVAGATGEASY